MTHNLTAVLTIAYRDVLKFTRDRMRMVTSLIFPVVFISVLGGSLQANLSGQVGYSKETENAGHGLAADGKGWDESQGPHCPARYDGLEAGSLFG